MVSGKAWNHPSYTTELLHSSTSGRKTESRLPKRLAGFVLMVASLLAALRVLTGLRLNIDLPFPPTEHGTDDLPGPFDWAKVSL